MLTRMVLMAGAAMLVTRAAAAQTVTGRASVTDGDTLEKLRVALDIDDDWDTGFHNGADTLGQRGTARVMADLSRLAREVA